MRENLLTFLIAFALCPAARAADPSSFNQKDSQINNYNQNSRGSDDSLQSSIPYGMQALMDLAGGKLTSAVKNGYNAYGKYRNAENLDHLKDRNALIANSMGSVDSAPVLNATPTNTTYRRLNPSFLKQGEAAKVAQEFEKQTGMKRETFLTQMADVSEQKVKLSDPMLIDKAFSRFESFVQKIPNQEFRKNIEKGVAMVPNTVRRGMVAQAVTKLAGMFADAGPAPSESTITALSKNKLADASSATTAVTGAAGTAGVTGTGASSDGKDGKDEITRDPASAEGALTAAVPGASEKGINGGMGKNGVEGAVAAALAAQGLDSQGDEAGGDATSIFSQVTKRYRILTPLLVKAP